MKNMRVLALFAALGVSPMPLYAQAPNFVRDRVAVCDPNFPSRCITPGADGSIATSGGSGGGNTVAPTAAGTSATTANPIQGVTGGVPVLVNNNGQYNSTLPTLASGTFGALQLTSTGALTPPVSASGKTIKTVVALAANTSTQLVAANVQRMSYTIQCGGTALVNVDETGGTLAGAVVEGTVTIPGGTYAFYTPPVASLTAITAYTATAQSCRVTEYNR